MRAGLHIAGLRADVDDAHGLPFIYYVGMLGHQLPCLLLWIGTQPFVGDQRAIVQIPFRHREPESEFHHPVGTLRREFGRGDHCIAGIVLEHAGISGMAGIVEATQMQFAIHPVRHICQQIGIAHRVGEHHFHP